MTRNDYWAPKIEENRSRDARHSLLLKDAGWTVIRVWEHEDPEIAAAAIVRVIRGKTLEGA